MTTPCLHEEVIGAIKEDVGEIKSELHDMRSDVKELVRVKNIALGVITASRVILLGLIGFIGWLIGIIFK